MFAAFALALIAQADAGSSAASPTTTVDAGVVTAPVAPDPFSLGSYGAEQAVLSDDTGHGRRGRTRRRLVGRAAGKKTEEGKEQTDRFVWAHWGRGQPIAGSADRNPDHSSTSTGNPTQASLSNVRASQLARRKQPWDSVRPTFSGSGVPWIP